MERFIHPVTGITYLTEVKNGKRFFYNAEGIELKNDELRVVRNRYEKEHPTKSETVEKEESGLKQGWNLLKENDLIYARGRTDFLEKVFGLRNKYPFRSSEEYNGRLIWTVYFDESIRDGWRNRFLSENECCQQNVEHKEKWDREDIGETFKLERVVFEIVGYGSTQKYVFRGIFEYEEEKSDPLGCAYFEKVADEFEFYKQ